MEITGAHTFPYIESKNHLQKMNTKLQRVKLKTKFLLQPTWNSNWKSNCLIVNGFSKEVLNKLPMEFAVEAQKLLKFLLKVQCKNLKN
jgi:Fe-S cluster assembly protein SufB